MAQIESVQQITSENEDTEPADKLIEQLLIEDAQRCKRSAPSKQELLNKFNALVGVRDQEPTPAPVPAIKEQECVSDNVVKSTAFVVDEAEVFDNAMSYLIDPIASHDRLDTSWSFLDSPEKLFRIAPFALATFHRIRDLVEWLLVIGNNLDVTAIRYHYLSDSDHRLVSVECAGHRDDVAARIRCGHISKSPGGAPIDQCDSYLCFLEKRPTLFMVTPRASVIERRPPIQGIIPFYAVKVDHCENVLISKKGRVWIDFPLISGGRFIGKLSCDISVEDIRQLDVMKLLAFWRLAQYAAPYFDSLYYSAVTAAFERTKEEINACASLDELLDYLTTRLPDVVFDCDYASVFLVSEDSDRRKLLVLHRTTDPLIKEFEHRKAYRLDNDKWLIPFVMSERRTLRFDNLRNESLREEQCQAQGVTIDWKDPFVKWERIGSVLISPIASSTRQSGVIQIAERRRRNGNDTAHFADRDQRLLDRLASECIGPKLQSLISSDEIPDLRSCLQWASSLARLENSKESIPDQILHLLQEAVPENGSRKLYMISKLAEDRKEFQAMAIRGELSKSCGHKAFHLKRSITERALNEHARRAVYWNELTDWLTPGAVCGLACRIEHNDIPIGAIVIKSDHYDLSLRKEGCYLELLADRASQLIASIANNKLRTDHTHI